jgi:protein SCO1/2
MRSNWLPWVLIVAIGCAGTAAGLWWRQHAPAAPQLATGTLLDPRPEMPNFTLIDHQGRPFTPGNLQGAWSLLFFGYTNCPDVCPTTLTTLAAMQKALRDARFVPLPQVVFISVDAARDTPAQLARYVPYFDPGFIGVTAATQPELEAFTSAMHVPVAIERAADGSYSVDHSAAIFVVAPDDRLAALLSGPFTAQNLAADWRLITGVRP